MFTNRNARRAGRLMLALGLCLFILGWIATIEQVLAKGDKPAAPLAKELRAKMLKERNELNTLAIASFQGGDYDWKIPCKIAAHQLYCRHES